MRKQIIIGNWKMNGSLPSIKTLCESLNSIAQAGAMADVAVCVPSVYLSYAKSNLKSIGLGVQNVSQYDDGAYTGEISVSMLQDFNCQYVIVGHSERRSLFQETNKMVAQKAKKVIEGGMTAIVCVGETLEQRTSGLVENVITKQLQAIFACLTKDQMRKVIIAYEPVWAIGTGLAATAKQVQQTHEFIRKVLIKAYENLANEINIVYGGSLKPSNAAEILSLSDVDGGLIGGASLKGKDFGQIIERAKQV